MSIMKPIAGGISNNTGKRVRFVTSESFDNQIISQDDHIPESVRIMRVIAEQNNSLLTREPLQINDLPLDGRSEVLSKQDRNRKQPKESGKIGRRFCCIRIQEGDLPSRKNQSCTNSARNNFVMIVGCLSIVLIGLIFGIAVVGTTFYKSDKHHIDNCLNKKTNVTSNYSGAIKMNSPIYFVDRYDRYGYKKIQYRYEKIRIQISARGFYQFQCNKVDYPYFVCIGTIDLYLNSFNAANLSMNRLTYKYGGEGIHGSYFGVSLRSANYILVVSVPDMHEKSFSILITGPASVAFS